MENIALTPQTNIYSIIPESNPLHDLARKFPKNMCWLTALFYALQFLGFENNRKLHYKLSYLLSSSLGLLFISKEDGAMYFPKKYELSDSSIKSSLNEIFQKTSLRVKVVMVMSDIRFEEIDLIQKYIEEKKELVCIVRNINLYDPTSQIIGQVANHTVLIKEFENLKNGRVKLTYLDPGDGRFHIAEIGVNIFMQWIQYIWVLERKYSVIEKFLKIVQKN